MIRVVLDTNVTVSALLQPLGPSAQLLILALGGSLRLGVSGSVYAEYEEVVSRPRFQRSPETIARALQAIRETGLWVRPTDPVNACVDPDEQYISGMRPSRARRLSGNRKHQAFSAFIDRNEDRNAALAVGSLAALSVPLVGSRRSTGRAASSFSLLNGSI